MNRLDVLIHTEKVLGVWIKLLVVVLALFLIFIGALAMSVYKDNSKTATFVVGNEHVYFDTVREKDGTKYKITWNATLIDKEGKSVNFDDNKVLTDSCQAKLIYFELMSSKFGMCLEDKTSKTRVK